MNYRKTSGDNMKLKEVTSLFYIKKEIKNLESKLLYLREKSLTKNTIFHPVMGSASLAAGDDFITNHINEIIQTENEISNLYKECEKINEFIIGIKDPEIRLIVRLRAEFRRTWEDIGNEVKYHRTAVSKKFYGFFAKSSQNDIYM